MKRVMMCVAGALLLPGCMDLDFLAHNAVHCSTVDPDTCDDGETGWDHICTTCGEPYDFGEEYDYFPGTLMPGQTVRPIPQAEVLNASIPTQDDEGVLDVYFIPAHGDDPEAAQITVLYNHGNYAGIEHYLVRVRFLYEAGYNVLVWDYRGYGKSMPSTPPSAEQFLDDARDIFNRAPSYAPDPSKILVYGYSLGAVPAIEMALTTPPCALVLESPLTSLNAIVRSNSALDLPGGFLSAGHFENDQKIKGYRGPLLVMSGSADQLFPIEDVQRLFNNAPGPDNDIMILDGVGHGISGGGVPEASLSLWMDKLDSFLDNAGACR